MSIGSWFLAKVVFHMVGLLEAIDDIATSELNSKRMALTNLSDLSKQKDIEVMEKLSGKLGPPTYEITSPRVMFIKKVIIKNTARQT